METSTATNLLTTLHPIPKSLNFTLRELGKEEYDMLSFTLGKISSNMRFLWRE